MATSTEYLRFLVTLTAVVDPFLAVPFFLAFTSGQGAAARTRLARAVSVTVFAVLAISTVAGEVVLTMIGASLPSFRVGGGLVLLLMALAMLNAEAGPVRHSEAEAQELQARDVGGIVPLAIPLLAGPGAISTTIIAAEHGGFLHRLVIISCIALICALLWLVLSNARRIATRVSMTGMNIMTRILGLLLAAMSVQTMAEGLRDLFPGLN